MIRPKPHSCVYGTFGVSDPDFKNGSEFTPSTNKYAQIAKAYEKYNNNNSTFNGKSLSDNRQITNFYSAKSHGIDHVHKMSPYIAELDSCQRNNLIVPENLSKPIPNKENGAMFSVNMLN